MKSLLVRLFGFRATLIHGDTLVLDRWLWLARYLPRVDKGSKRVLDVGCGSGGFTIGAALRGYQSLGLGWDQRNQRVATARATLCHAQLAAFEMQDVRRLDERTDLAGSFDIVICCENIEHVLDDRKLMRDMAACLKPGGALLLTSPNWNNRPMSGDSESFLPIEDGRHVRKGYTHEDLKALCDTAGLAVGQIGYCSGFTSQKVTTLFRVASSVNDLFGWAAILPLRAIPPVVDRWLARLLNWPGYCVTLVATKGAES